MDCPACGGDNRSGAKFCRSCGLALEATTGTNGAPDGPLGDQAQATVSPVEAGGEARGVEQEASPEAVAVAASALASRRGTVAEPPAAQGAVRWEDAESADDRYEVNQGRQPLRPEAALEERRVLPDLSGELPVEEEASSDGSTPAPVKLAEPRADIWAEVSPGLEESTADLPGAEISSDAELRDRGPAPDAGETLDGSGPFAPAQTGNLLAGRYLVVGVEEVGQEEVLYHVQDLKVCWQCEFEENLPGDGYCARCGVALDRWPDRDLLELRDPESGLQREDAVAAQLDHEGRTFLVLARPTVEQTPEGHVPPKSLRLVVGHRSDEGLVRQLNEDSLLALSLSATYETQTDPVIGLFAVSDGMGGHEGGEIASRLALQVIAREVLQNIIAPELAGDAAPADVVKERLRMATVAANDTVYLARQKRENDMGTTLTTALVRGDQLFIAHVGDSRAYRWNEEGLHQLTIDHSLVATMVATGRAEPEEIYTHPQRSVIYRSIGDQAVVEVDTDVQPLSPGDRVIVCCDGLWEMIRDEGIADVMMEESDPQAACELLVDRANAAGGEDNISAIVVQVEAL